MKKKAAPINIPDNPLQAQVVEKGKPAKPGCVRRLVNFTAVVIIFLVVVGLLLPGKPKSPGNASPTAAQLPAGGETDAAATVAATATNTSAPPTATITDTPAPTATSPETAALTGLQATIQAAQPLADDLSREYAEVAGLTEVEMVSVIPSDPVDYIVYSEVRTVAGANFESLADQMQQIAAAALVTASMEFSVIFNDGTRCADYTFDNGDDAWRVTPLTCPGATGQAVSSTESAQDVAARIVRENISDEVISVEADAVLSVVTVQYRMPQTFDSYDVAATQQSMARLACALRASGQFDRWRYLLQGVARVMDGAGNNSEDAKGLNVLLLPEAISQMDCDNIASIVLKNYAATYDLNPLLASQDTTVQSAEPPTSLVDNVLNVPAETYYAESGGVNIRSCPKTSCERVGSVEAGTALVVNGMVDGDSVQAGNSIWYRLAYGGQEAYVYSGLMSKAAPVSAPAAQPATSGGQSSAPAGNTFTCPSNCTEAVAMGVSAQQAAQCGLDRDGDGVACYGD